MGIILMKKINREKYNKNTNIECLNNNNFCI